MSSLAITQRLLIISCSRRKTQKLQLAPAIERYDGPIFRLVRRFLNSEKPEQLNVYILSAEFGLIPSTEPIPNYDRQMTQERAQDLKPSCDTALKQIFAAESYQDICICASQIYLRALADIREILLPPLNLRFIKGGLGKQLAELHDWLYGKPPKLLFNANQQRSPCLRGIEVRLTAEELMNLARQRLTESMKEAVRYHAWYVLVDSQQVASKWLVSQITGLPVSAFNAGEARRLLTQLGIVVQRVSAEESDHTDDEAKI